jgi:hypothetical protein
VTAAPAGEPPWVMSYAAGAATTLGLVAAVRSLVRRKT